MNFKEYIERAESTAVYPGQSTFKGLGYVVSGLAGEVGEVFEVLKKIIRDSAGVITVNTKQRLFEECSDCFWYTSQIFNELKSKSNLFDINVNKLQEECFKGFTGTTSSLLEDKLTQQRSILIKVHSLVSNILDDYSFVELNGCNEEDDNLQNISENTSKVLLSLFVFLKNIEINVEDVLKYNLDKLASRKERNVLSGSGSNR